MTTRDELLARRRELYQLNRDQVRARQKVWYYNNHEKMLAYHRKYRRNHIDSYRQRFRSWYYKNHEYALDRARIYRETNPEQHREANRRWTRENPDKALANWQRNRARRSNAPTVAFTPEKLRAKMSYWGFRCWMCGGDFEHVDHVSQFLKVAGTSSPISDRLVVPAT